jgi:hypothetical protein
MNTPSSTGCVRNNLAGFTAAQDEIGKLDHVGKTSSDICVYLQYQRRNCFGLDLSTKIYRIFQEDYYQEDRDKNQLTLPRADAVIWGSALENPLAAVNEPDPATGGTIDLGSAVRSFFALCWTSRPYATQDDWESFSHGRRAVRIETTIGKLLDRVMLRSDPAYMHRAWVIDVDYQSPSNIRAMQTANGVWQRLESTGHQLALSAATVQTSYKDENEVRFLFDAGIEPKVSTEVSPDLLTLNFQWNGFVDNITYRP